MDKINLFIYEENRMMEKNTKKRILPVTIVTGYLGSGKTTLLRHILQNKLNLRVACIVNDYAAINIDEKLVLDGSTHLPQEKGQAGMLRLTNGSFCCPFILDESCANLKDVVWKCIENDLENSEKIDYLVIETSGTTDPIQIISTLQQRFGKMTRARLDSVVTIVDCDALLGQMEENSSLENVAIRQLECADIVLLNKVDLVDQKSMDTIHQIVREKSPRSTIYECNYCAVALPRILEVELPTRSEKVMNHETVPSNFYASESGGKLRVTASSTSSQNPIVNDFISISYSSNKPFGFSNFQDFLMNQLPHGVKRVKGVVYFSELPKKRYVFHLSGRRRMDMQQNGVVSTSPVCEIVVIGHELDEKKIYQALELCTFDQDCKLLKPDAILQSLRFCRDTLQADERFQIVDNTDEGETIVTFRLICPGVSEDSRASKHFHHVDINRMNRELVRQFNSCAYGGLLVIKTLENGDDAILVAAHGKVAFTQLWNTISHHADRIIADTLSSLTKCMCGF